jgi:hypothetical protein
MFFRRVRRRTAVIGTVAVLALTGASTAMANYEQYLWQQTVGAGLARSGYDQHNHYDNSMCPCGGSWPTGIYEHTLNLGDHYIKNGYGTLDYVHGTQYYAWATCWNRDSVSHFVSECHAEW